MDNIINSEFAGFLASGFGWKFVAGNARFPDAFIISFPVIRTVKFPQGHGILWDNIINPEFTGMHLDFGWKFVAGLDR